MKLLRVDGITKSFGSLMALNRVSLEVEEKSIHAIIGPNGAGKTTLLNIITGIHRADAGEIIFQDEVTTNQNSYQISRMGIARSFQTVRIFNNMSVLENVMIGLENVVLRRESRLERYKNGLRIFFRFPFHENQTDSMVQKRAEGLLKVLGLMDQESYLAAELPLIKQRRLEIARALATNPQLLLLDEPTAGMTLQESIEIQNLIHSLCVQGITIILISHEMRLVSGVAHRVSVINFGVKIAEGTVEEVMNDPGVVKAYLGERK